MIDSIERQQGTAQILLATKLYIPRARPTLLSRTRLLERLSAGLQGPVTLISAPTGSGKTALLTDWIHAHTRLRSEHAEATDEHPIAWLSLDPGDDDLLPFLRYLVAACQTLLPSAGRTVVALLDGRVEVAHRPVITALINDLARVAAPSILVLDDYHVVSDGRIHDAVTFLLDHLPPQVHVVITSRVDPPLPLARWRAHGILTELRATDLRFTAEEATAFLTQVMRLPLSRPVVEALEQRTEGWIAGLQFAALAMRDRTDPENFVRAFTGNHRFVLDFLVDEVLLRQPPHIQTFLLQTSILDRMCASLCDAVMGVDDLESAASQNVLEELEQANLFVVPLDDARQWYRYHHLFADVLRHRLQSGASPDKIRLLHSRAIAWFEQHGYLDEAVRQALAGSAFATAARLLEQQTLARVARGDLATLRQLLAQIPDDVIRARPMLGRALMIGLIFAGRFREIEPCLEAIEQGLAQADDDAARGEQTPANATHLLAGEVAASRAIFANLREQTDLARALSNQAGSR